MARKKKHEEHENLERWLVSYADFVTLLFAFFVVMYSVSAVNEGKFRVLSEALAAAFRSNPRSLQPIQVGKPAKSPFLPHSQYPDKPPPAAIILAPRSQIAPPRMTNLPKTNIHVGANNAGAGQGAQGSAGSGAGGVAGGMAKMAADIEKSMSALISKKLVLVRRDKHNLWMEVEIKSSVLFKSGSADVDPDAIPVLWKVANVLRDYPYSIQVEGFTDNVPIHTREFPSNWELSAGRAASVVHLFTDAGVAPDRMAAVGYGQYHPVASNTTEEGRRKNRRVVLVMQANAAAHASATSDQGQAAESPSEPAAAPTAAPTTTSGKAPPAPEGAMPGVEPERLVPTFKGNKP